MKNGGSPFVWYELMTSDAKQAQDFYSKVIGWTAKDAGMPGMKHTLFDALGCTIAGMMALSDLPGKAVWMPVRAGSYIGVADVDAAAEKVMAEGGKSCARPAIFRAWGALPLPPIRKARCFRSILQRPIWNLRPISARARLVIRAGTNYMPAMARPYSRFTRRFSAGSFRGILTWGRWENTRFSVSMAPIWGHHDGATRCRKTVGASILWLMGLGLLPRVSNRLVERCWLDRWKFQMENGSSNAATRKTFRSLVSAKE